MVLQTIANQEDMLMTVDSDGSCRSFDAVDAKTVHRMTQFGFGSGSPCNLIDAILEIQPQFTKAATTCNLQPQYRIPPVLFA
jgi:hypothetical protein